MKERTVVVAIDGMTCAACADHVRQALAKVPGVSKVELADHRSPFALVVAEESVQEVQLVRAVERAGYRAKLQAEAPGEAGRGGGKEYDLLIVGGGSAAFAAAIYAAEQQASVLMVNEGTLGGTCVNVGCVPSKVLIRAVEAYHRAGEQRFPGVFTSKGALFWPQLVAFKEQIVESLRKAKYEQVLAAYPGIAYRAGKARLTPQGALVDGEHIRARRVLVATGASPLIPPIPGLAEAGYLTSTTAMTLRKLPSSLLVLGANAVGLELAQTFARAGVAVTLVELLPRIAPFEDEEVSEALARFLAADGIAIAVASKAVAVERRGGGVLVTIEHAGGSREVLPADEILVATGRRPNTAGLGLEEVGVQLDSRGAVIVNQWAQTSNPAIFAAGDCTNLPQFVYVAAHAGTVAAANALAAQPTRRLALDHVPRVIFTDPQVAAVGLSERQARDQGLEVVAQTLALEHVPKAVVSADHRGLIKLVAAGSDARLVGVHVVASEAAEIIQIGVLALQAGLSVEALAGMIFPYLTLAEGLKIAAQSFFRDVGKLSCCAG